MQLPPNPTGTYFPILKGKTGELNALEGLAAEGATIEAERFVRPIVEVPAPSSKQEAKMSIAEYAQQTGGRLNDKLKAYDPILDFRLFPEALSGPVSKAFFDEYKRPRPAISVSSELGERQDDALALASKGKLVLRLVDADFSGSSEDLASMVKRSLEAANAKLNETILVLDLGSVTATNLQRDARSTRSMISEIPHLNDFGSFILASAGFPSPVSTLAGQRQAFVRSDKMLYDLVVTGMKGERRPDYGDYGVTARDLPEMKEPRVAPKLIYTRPADWYVGKESKVKGERETFRKVRDIARDILDLKDWRGKAFSPGDEAIWDLANPEETMNDTTGNATSWVTAALSHHIAVVVGERS